MMYDFLIILNNFTHDLAAAMWFCGTLTLYFIVQQGEKEGKGPATAWVKNLFAKVKVITNISLAIVLVGGSIRALNYYQYEWLPALGRSQITLLIVKHTLLAFIVIFGVVLQVRLKNKLKL